MPPLFRQCPFCPPPPLFTRHNFMAFSLYRPLKYIIDGLIGSNCWLLFIGEVRKNHKICSLLSVTLSSAAFPHALLSVYRSNKNAKFNATEYTKTRY